ncbi:ClpP/crotonase [Glonium stellatum]|uniref:ClpP/crotonase n=1 Tax=Glonium stellatum TaxID=574774 RepID=A0A8E2EMZ9_9PEZI|nr:ClpP/crotonase [Glonium stellatum]
MVAALRGKRDEGAYDNVTSAPDFTRVLTKDMRAVSHDLHLGIFFVPHTEPREAPPSNDTILEHLRAIRFGFGHAKRLDGGITVLPVFGFVPTNLPEAKDAISDIMAGVADAAVLILDLRENGGGQPDTVAWVAGFLFGDKKVHLNDMYYPHEGRTEEYWTQPPAPETRFGLHKPLYVLVSNMTGSGGEELPYDLQALGRATVIGEATVGAGNLPWPCTIKERWIALVPNAYPINPITGRNWEGVGVEPDVKIIAGEALEEAVRKARAELRLPPEEIENEKEVEGGKLMHTPLYEKQHVLGEA